MASIFRRGKTWTVTIEVGDDPVTGRRKKDRYPGFRTKREAIRASIEIEARRQRGEHVAPRQTTVAEYLLGQWLPAIRSTLKPSSYESYRMSVESRIVPRIGHLTLQRLTPADINAMYADLLSTGKRPKRQAGEDAAAYDSRIKSKSTGLSPSSVVRTHAALRRALRDAVRWGLLSRNVAADSDPPRQPRPGENRAKVATWNEEQMRSFFEASRSDRLYPLWRLTAMTGLRRAELAGLSWDDVDLESATLAVRRTRVASNYTVTWQDPKTRRARRSIALDQGTVAALSAHRTRQLEDRMAFGKGYADAGLVFTREDGTPMHPDSISATWRRRVRAANAAVGVPVIRFHALRHSHATCLCAAGENVKMVSDRLGHADVAFTLNTYADAMPALERSSIDSLAARLAE